MTGTKAMAAILMGDTLSLVAYAVFFLVVWNVEYFVPWFGVQSPKTAQPTTDVFEYRIIRFNFWNFRAVAYSRLGGY